MKERPILFSTEMVQAILEGRKTQTRRILKPQIEKREIFWNWNGRTASNSLEHLCNVAIPMYCPYGQPGDRLWVREKFAKTMGDFEPEICFSFFADDFHWSWKPGKSPKGKTSCQWRDPELSEGVKWKPARYMPIEAARIWLEVEEVRVERLESISDQDAKAEGINFVVDKITGGGYDYLIGGYNLMITPRHSFMSLWRKVHGIERYKPTGNPWVWVIKFKVLSVTGKPSFEDVDWEKLKALKKLYDEAGSPIPLCKGGRGTSNK
ncbi:MAG TPA: hypothetical protein VLH16_01720 [Bacteroidales bacterium]|nr:hypothetical protein [Bacteroidales bacterium]